MQFIDAKKRDRSVEHVATLDAINIYDGLFKD